MVFLDFFEALLGCAEVYVIEASEQPNVTVMTRGGEQQVDVTAEIMAEQTAAPSMTHSLSAVEQVRSATIYSTYTLNVVETSITSRTS